MLMEMANGAPTPYIELRTSQRRSESGPSGTMSAFMCCRARWSAFWAQRCGKVGGPASHHGFSQADSGRVIVAGEDITDYNEEQLELIRRKSPWSFRMARSSIL